MKAISKKIEIIKIEDLTPCPNNPRRSMDEAAMKELAQSIAAVGLLQPITVRPAGDDSYEIVCGHRRYEAAKLAGLEALPCIVRTLTDDEAWDVMVTENLQRRDIDPFEESEAFNALLSRGRGVAELAARFGKSETYVRGRCALSALLPEFREKYDAGLVRLTHCIILAGLEPDMQRKMLAAYYSGGYSDISGRGVDALRMSINRFAGDIKDAPFDTTPCQKCRHNLASGKLFPDEGRAQCGNLRCYAAKYAGAQLHWFEEAREGNPDFFIIDPEGMTLQPWDAALADLLRDKGFTFRKDEPWKYDTADNSEGRFDHKGGTAACYSFGWGGMRFTRKNAEPVQSKPTKNDWWLDSMAEEREEKTADLRMDAVHENILEMEDGTLRLMTTCTVEATLKAALCLMVQDYDAELPFGLTNEEGVYNLEAANMAELCAALAAVVALNIDANTEGEQYVRQIFRDCYEGTQERAERAFLDNCRQYWYNWGEVTDEMIEEDLAQRLAKNDEKRSY